MEIQRVVIDNIGLKGLVDRSKSILSLMCWVKIVVLISRSVTVNIAVCISSIVVMLGTSVDILYICFLSLLDENWNLGYFV
jgi:hypothetical protein